MKRLTCWWKGHEYVVVGVLTHPLNKNVVCLRCFTGSGNEGVRDPLIDLATKGNQ